MKPLTVVIAQSDPKNAEVLAASLRNHFRAVHTAGSYDEARNAVPKNRADLLVLDLELAPLDEVTRLRAEMPATGIICTHRLADEELWAQALAAGALDCCHNSDVRGIVLAATGDALLARSTAA